MSKKEPSSGMLNAPRHFHHILHNLLHRSSWYGHVDSANGNHEIESGHDIACILNKFVQIRKVVAILRMRLIKIVGKVAERVKNSHVYRRVNLSKSAVVDGEMLTEFIVLLGS
jgi:hypothetical protein